MVEFTGWQWVGIVVVVLVVGYFWGRQFLWDLKDLTNSGKNLMNRSSRLSRRIGDNRALRSYSPETEAVIKRISASENGEFVLNSGVLSQQEIAGLSRLQLAKFLVNSTAMVELCGKDVFAGQQAECREAILKELSKG